MVEQFLYRVHTKYGERRFYRLEEAEKCFEREGSRLYAYTKDLRPTKVLLKWK